MSLNEYELPYWEKNQYVIGIDEAGRGPLAGPLVVAGCILVPGFDHPEINDSKKLTEKKRAALFDEIVNEALSFDIEIVEPSVIDEYNIYKATQLTMEKIAMYLNAETVLVDAMPLSIEKETISIIKGDAKSISIAAASILAKVTRDRIMMEYDAIYPQYNFKKHKGYPTKEHLELLQKYGPNEIYRYSYAPVQKASLPKLNLFDENC